MIKIPRETKGLAVISARSSSLGTVSSSKLGQLDPCLLDYIAEPSLNHNKGGLSTADKKVVFVLDTPFLGFSPYACISRPFRLMNSELVKTPCTVSRFDVDNRRKKYLEMVSDVLKDFPKVAVWDPLLSLCDEKYCWAVKDGKILYHDDNHLNKAGAIYVGKYFQNFGLKHDSTSNN